MADTYSREGAERLARTIARKWRQRGETVSAWVEPMSIGDQEVFIVKSDLVNGLPTQQKLAQAA